MNNRALTHTTSDFEGTPLTTITYKGRPAWIAREIGAAVGYSEGGKQLVRNITGDWANEFVDDDDFVSIAGAELADIKEALRPGGDFPLGESTLSSRASALVLLFEPGLNIALMKTNKPEGVRLRRFLATDVMPQLSRGGAYLPEREVKNDQIVDKPSAALERERRLNRKLELEEKKLALASIQGAVERIEGLSPEAVRSLQVAALEIGTGREFSGLKPEIEPNWLSPTQIAATLSEEDNKVTPNAVGRIISKLELRGNIEGMCRAILNVAPTTGRNVETYLYSPKAVHRIIEAYKQLELL